MDAFLAAERSLLPPGFERGHVFVLPTDNGEANVEVDGFHPASREAIEIYAGGPEGASPKPGLRRKLASDALKLVFLRDAGMISRGRMIVTNPELYTWFHQGGSWLTAACRRYDIDVELKTIPNKRERKRVRRALANARKKEN